MNNENELTAALATIEKCREITSCPAGVDLQGWLKQLTAENMALEKARAENTAGVSGMAESYETTISMLRSRIAELESRTVTVKMPEVYGYLRVNDGQIQIYIGAERPSDRSGGYATPWFAIYTAAGIKREVE